MNVCVVLPALNEEKTIGMTIDDIPINELEKVGYNTKVLVVDNGSSDSTHDVALHHGSIVITGNNRGKGNAIKDAQKYLRESSYDFDFIVMMDSDYTYPGRYVLNAVNLLRWNDIVLGSRLSGRCEKGAMSPLNTIGNKMLTLIGELLFGVNISDMCTGLWGFKKEKFCNISITEKGFGLEANLYAQCAKLHYKIAEFPIVYRKRPTPPKLKSIEDGFRICLALVKQRMTK